MADFPDSTFAPATLVDDVDDVLASHQNLPNEEIVAIENFLLNIASGPAGFGHNYVIVPSVASNHLTITLEGIDGNDPSADNPLRFRIGDAMFKVTAATAFTKNSGTNWCNAGASELAANPIDFFVYAIAETGASAGIKFGFSRIPYARTMNDFSSTNTNEKYIAGNWTNFNTTDIVENIGSFRAQLSASASFNWSIATQRVINRPVFETDWLTWAPTFAGNASMNYTSVTASLAKYRIRGRSLEAQLNMSGTTSGTASNILKASPPFTFANSAFFGGALVAAVFGGVRLNSGNLEFLKYDLSNYALTTVAGSTSGFYEI